MLKHLLVPLDGSALSEQALDYAQNVIAPEGKITILSVIEVPSDYEYALVDIPMTVVSGTICLSAQSASDSIQVGLESTVTTIGSPGITMSSY